MTRTLDPLIKGELACGVPSEPAGNRGRKAAVALAGKGKRSKAAKFALRPQANRPTLTK